MRKLHLGPGLGELDDGTDPAMSVGVATERATGTDLRLSGLVHPDGTPVEQARHVFETVADVVVNDLGGATGDVTMLRFYVRSDRLTDALRRELHAVRREFFDAPEFPAATMVGVDELVHDDAAVEIEAAAFVPDGEWTVETVRPD
ncbi:RidA family protein [Haloarcula litorea]|uniref:RidA family protein n=1 Tax=Haloarcula litorea TaxID=3032579 RepID=UPI0023E80376|nr:RidA family protein [Halomicroarcula sp. GDY20]